MSNIVIEIFVILVPTHFQYSIHSGAIAIWTIWTKNFPATLFALQYQKCWIKLNKQGFKPLINKPRIQEKASNGIQFSQWAYVGRELDV